MARVAVALLCVVLQQLLLLLPSACAPSSSVDGVGVLAFRRHPKIVVRGHVFCDQCLQGLSSVLTVPLEDAEVGVTCVDVYGFVTYNAVAYTSVDGSFKIPLDNLPFLYGVKGCKARLVSSGNFNCSLASSVGGGNAGAKLVLNSRSLKEVVFNSGPFAYRPPRPLHLCSVSTSPPFVYYRRSPPPPASSSPSKPLPSPTVSPVHKNTPPFPCPPPPPGKPQHEYKLAPPPVGHSPKPPSRSPPSRRPKPVEHMPPPPDNHKPKSPPHHPLGYGSPNQPDAPPAHHGHKAAPPSLVEHHPSPPPPRHCHQGHPSPPPPSPGYFYTLPPPPHHGHQGHKDGKPPPKHKLPPLPRTPLPQMPSH